MIDDALIKRADETDLGYHKRLIYGKLVDKTLADADYSELAEAIYGKPYSSDVARRMLYGSRNTLELLEREGVRDVDESYVLDMIEREKKELQKERNKFYDQRREYKKLLLDESRNEHLCDALIDAASKLNYTIGDLYENEDDKWAYPENDAVLVLSDWHYGMTTDNIYNVYNVEVCKGRVKKVVTDVKERLLLHGCNILHVVILGDLFHGAIHTSARVASEELVCDQIMQVSEILAQSIAELSQYAVRTEIYMTYGNHGRTVQKKSDNIHGDNMERLIPWWLEQRFKDRDCVHVNSSDTNEFVFINSCGHEFCATHGDLDYVQSSGKILGTLFFKRLGKDIEYILIGDKHHRGSSEELGITTMLCGSLCGTDDYANDKRLFSTPSQLLLIVNAENGVDAEYRIACN